MNYKLVLVLVFLLAFTSYTHAQAVFNIQVDDLTKGYSESSGRALINNSAEIVFKYPAGAELIEFYKLAYKKL